MYQFSSLNILYEFTHPLGKLRVAKKLFNRHIDISLLDVKCFEVFIVEKFNEAMIADIFSLFVFQENVLVLVHNESATFDADKNVTTLLYTICSL